MMAEDSIRDALNMIPYGFYAIGSRNGDDVNLMVVNWLTQSSFAPRQVAFGLSQTAVTHGIIAAGKVFSVNILDRGDADLITGLTKSRAKYPDKVRDADTTPGPQTGCPLLSGAAAWLECRVVASVDSGGDHDVIVGEVIGAGVNRAGKSDATLTLETIGWSYSG